MNSTASYEQIHSSVASTNAVALCIQTAQVHFNMDKPMSYYCEWYPYAVQKDGEYYRTKITILYSPPMNGVGGW